MTAIVFGCGYLGRRVAGLWAAAGRTVYAVTRRADRAEDLAREGLHALVADVTRPETLRGLPPARTVLYAVGYDPRSHASREQVYVQGLRAVLDALPDRVEKVVFTSSTGVYGSSGGRWVDELTPCRPTRDAGRAMLAAEETLRSHRLGDRAIVLRLAGLYGPGRVPRLADVRAGRPIEAAEGACLNLIHVEDAARVVVAAAERTRPPRTYVVSDGHPTDRREFYLYLAELLGSPPPRFVDPSPQGAADRRGGADKRVKSARMIEELGLILAYPTYREGLRAIVR